MPLLLGPGIVALFSGGYSDTARAAAGVAAWLLLAATAIALPRPLPRSRPAQVAALAALAALTAWTAAWLAWAPLGEPAGEDVQRLLLYLAVLAAATRILREPAAARLAEPLLLAGIAGATAVRALGAAACRASSTSTDVLSAGDRLAQPLTYWNGTGAFAALGLVLAAGIAGAPERARGRARRRPRRRRRVLGLALYLTFSRGGLGAAAAGLAVLLALAPTRAQRARRGCSSRSRRAVPALATLALPAVAQEKSGCGQGAAMLALLVVRRRRAPRCSPAGPAAPGGGRAADARCSPPARSCSRWPAARSRSRRSSARAAATTRRPRRAGSPPCRATATPTGRSRCARSATTRSPASAAAASRRSGCASGRSASPCATPTRSTSRRRPSSGSSASRWCSRCSAPSPWPRAAPRPALAGPVAALAAYALHAGVDWDWELPALTLVALVLAGLVLSYQPELGARLGMPEPHERVVGAAARHGVARRQPAGEVLAHEERVDPRQLRVHEPVALLGREVLERPERGAVGARAVPAEAGRVGHHAPRRAGRARRCTRRSPAAAGSRSARARSSSRCRRRRSRRRRAPPARPACANSASTVSGSTAACSVRTRGLAA